MPIQNYANFDLEIDRTATANTYRAHVLSFPGGPGVR